MNQLHSEFLLTYFSPRGKTGKNHGIVNSIEPGKFALSIFTQRAKTARIFFSFISSGGKTGILIFSLANRAVCNLSHSKASSINIHPFFPVRQSFFRLVCQNSPRIFHQQFGSGELPVEPVIPPRYSH